MSALLDLEAFDVLVEAIGAEGIRPVVELFIGESRELVAAIAAPGADCVAIGRAAHSLKSSAGQLGAAALSAAALAVENAAHAGNAELPQLIAALGDCAGATRGALAARLSGL